MSKEHAGLKVVISMGLTRKAVMQMTLFFTGEPVCRT